MQNSRADGGAEWLEMVQMAAPERNTYPDISLFAGSYQSQLKMEAVPSTPNPILTLPNKIAL